MIYNINPAFLLAYQSVQGKEKLTTEEMFRRLSVEMGGDGTTITKKQLDSYLEKAKSGDVKLSRQKLSALMQMQKNWDTISKGKDSITAADMKGYEVLLMATMVESFTAEDEADGIDDFKSELQNLLLKNTGLSDIKDASDSQIKNYLNTLLSDTSDDDTIGEAIDSLINVIADRQNVSTVEAEA